MSDPAHKAKFEHTVTEEQLSRGCRLEYYVVLVVMPKFVELRAHAGRLDLQCLELRLLLLLVGVLLGDHAPQRRLRILDARVALRRLSSRARQDLLGALPARRCRLLLLLCEVQRSQRRMMCVALSICRRRGEGRAALLQHHVLVVLRVQLNVGCVCVGRGRGGEEPGKQASRQAGKQQTCISRWLTRRNMRSSFFSFAACSSRRRESAPA